MKACCTLKRRGSILWPYGTGGGLTSCGLEFDRLLAEILLIAAITAAFAAAAGITVLLLTASLPGIAAALRAALLLYRDRAIP